MECVESFFNIADGYIAGNVGAYLHPYGQQMPDVDKTHM